VCVHGEIMDSWPDENHVYTGFQLAMIEAAEEDTKQYSSGGNTKNVKKCKCIKNMVIEEKSLYTKIFIWKMWLKCYSGRAYVYDCWGLEVEVHWLNF
jgi:hypothetical protein